MLTNYEIMQVFKLEIMAKLYSVHPKPHAFTAEEYGCDLFVDPNIYMSPDSAQAKKIKDEAEILASSFVQLQADGHISMRHPTETYWMAELTASGYEFMKQDVRIMEQSKTFGEYLSDMFRQHTREFAIDIAVAAVPTRITVLIGMHHT